MSPRSEDELEELLATPSGADIAAMAALDGDLMILGAAGKMGPSLAHRARRALDAAGSRNRVIAVARFTEAGLREKLEAWGVETLASDLLDDASLAALPEAPNIVFMVGRKFGSTGAENLTWAINAGVPLRAATRYRNSRIVAFSSGNVYPLMPVASGGATEETQPEPVGEYAQSALARERMLEYAAAAYGTPSVILRLNYAIDLRYGVLLDIGTNVFERRPVDLTMGTVNVIWQGDANSVCLRSFGLCSSPPAVLNLTGPETLPVRWIASRFGALFGVEPQFQGTEAPTALLNNAARCQQLFGYPSMSPSAMIEHLAQWIGSGGRTLNKPTHFETRDGKF